MKKIFILLVMCSQILSAISSEEAAKKSYEAISGYKSSIAQTTMILQNAQGDRNIRKLEIRRLEDAKGDRSLLIFLYPKDLKGTKLLSYEVVGGNDKQWLYLPAIKRIKRISSRNKSGSFMGSEFSYEDIASRHYKNYRYDGEAVLTTKNARRCLRIVRYPIDSHSGYSKQIVYLDSQTYVTVYGDFFDKRGRLLKQIVFSDYTYRNGVYRVGKIEVYNVQNNKKSTLVWDSDTIFAGLGRNDFTKRALR